ncbi:MAG: winged helix-turn-helix transcriptional regulator [Candidatus Hadarchaeales archaeon]
MDTKEMLAIVAVVVVLQLCLSFIVYLFSPFFDLSALVVAVAIMASVAGSIAAILLFLFKRYATERAVRVAMLTLSEDERKVLNEILREGEIRQDVLRRRVDMSKSKLSALVNNLEKKGAIIKIRYHKTNILRATKEFGGKS